MWENVKDTLDGFYLEGKFKTGISRLNFEKVLSVDSGFIYTWDSTAQAPFSYNPHKQLFIIYHNEKSITLKHDIPSTII